MDGETKFASVCNELINPLMDEIEAIAEKNKMSFTATVRMETKMKEKSDGESRCLCRTYHLGEKK
jgi:hypothetical protein